MTEKDNIFSDIMDGLHEVVEYQKGNLQLRTSVVEIPDENIIAKFGQLNDSD